MPSHRRTTYRRRFGLAEYISAGFGVIVVVVLLCCALVPLVR